MKINLPQDTFWNTLSRPTKPPNDTQAGLKWVWNKGHNDWMEVCDTCGSNCGQCGMTNRIGRLAKELHDGKT